MDTTEVEAEARLTASRGSGLILDPELEQEVIDRMEGASWIVLGHVSAAMRDASIRLNNEAMLLPEADWKYIQKECRHFDALSEFYATLCVQRMP